MSLIELLDSNREGQGHLMFFRTKKSVQQIASSFLADSSSLVSGYNAVSVSACGSSENIPLSNSDLSHSLEAERQEASHHLAILSNSIFVSVGC
jgi:hypothetical protein